MAWEWEVTGGRWENKEFAGGAEVASGRAPRGVRRMCKGVGLRGGMWGCERWEVWERRFEKRDAKPRRLESAGWKVWSARRASAPVGGAECVGGA